MQKRSRKCPRYVCRCCEKDGIIFDHCPWKISLLCSIYIRHGGSIFIRRGGSITCQVNGNRRYSRDLPQGGLKVSYILTFCTSKKAELEKLITNAFSTEIGTSLSYWFR